MFIIYLYPFIYMYISLQTLYIFTLVQIVKFLWNSLNFDVIVMFKMSIFLL